MLRRTFASLRRPHTNFEVYEISRLARADVLCNEADLHHGNGPWMWRGDAVDIALLSFAHKWSWKLRNR